MLSIVIPIICVIVTLVVAIPVSFLIFQNNQKKVNAKKIGSAEEQARQIIDDAVKKYICEQCEHESIIRQIVLKEYLEEYLKVPASFYDHKPQGTFQEEYFAMKYLGFAKVSAFRDAPTKRIVFFSDNFLYFINSDFFAAKVFFHKLFVEFCNRLNQLFMVLIG